MRTPGVGILSLAALSLAGPAVAGELAGVTLPDQVTVESRTLVLNGMGLREATFLKVDVYVAGLYLERKSSAADEIVSSDQAKRLVEKGFPQEEAHAEFARQDAVTLRQDSFLKALDGITTLEEVFRLSQATQEDA